MEEATRLRPEWAVKALIVMVIASIQLNCVSARANHSVGGASGWDLSSDVQAWSAATIFHVGDCLVFSYTPAHDVLEVSQQQFVTCRTTNPISAHYDGETVVQLTQPGPRFFICGRRGHCLMGLKFRVDVLPQVQSNANETRSRGRPPYAPPRRPPPPPPAAPAPGGDDDEFPPPFPDTTPGPCADSGVGGMVTAQWLAYQRVSVTTMMLLSGVGMFFI